MDPPDDSGSDTYGSQEIFNIRPKRMAMRRKSLILPKTLSNDVVLFIEGLTVFVRDFLWFFSSRITGSVPLAASYSCRTTLSYPLSSISCFEGSMAVMQALAAL